MNIYLNQYKTKLHMALVYKCISDGDVEAIKFLFKSIYSEDTNVNLAAVNCLRVIGINMYAKLDSLENFDSEYLYYLAMALIIGPINVNIANKMKTTLAKRCFDIVKFQFPQAAARTAYIDLVELPNDHRETKKEYDNLNILQDWREKGDLFSLTVLAKIKNYEWIETAKELVLSHEAIELLAHPIDLGYPPAVRYYNDLTGELRKTRPKGSDDYGRFDIDVDTLLDLEV